MTRFLSIAAATVGLWLILARLLAMVPFNATVTDWLVRLAGLFGDQDAESVERVWVASVFFVAAVFAIVIVWFVLRMVRQRNPSQTV
ncbi:hypothetical protein WS72_13390 [Burkholderia savannae]|uniref:Uncharacterized protein n=1 Tax=Burkholderia savannae TaxID=1637837 RepID=A0ABR5TFW0_9BURK|nr:hypothetical protein WS72_13390 [Burkholderia savannae]